MVGARKPRSFMLWKQPFGPGKKKIGAEKEKFGRSKTTEKRRKKQRKRMNQYDILKNHGNSMIFRK